MYEGHEATAAALYPLKKLGETADIAALAAFLIFDEARWLTGQPYVADGGVTLMGIG